MNAARPALAVFAFLLVTPAALAQAKDEPRVKEPPRAEKLDVQIRYRIRADRDERIRQYRLLVKHLEALGFEDDRKNDPDRDLDALDPNAERFTGKIASARVFDILDDSRVLNILFAPTGYMYPDERDKPVNVRIVLRGGLLPAMQQVFHVQTLIHLERLGFQEALGYDTRGYTQLKGTIPYKYLDRLVKDLRTEPAGWFLADTPVDRLPRPFADRNPVRWVEVMPPAPAPPPFVPAVVLPNRAKLTPELRAVLADPALKETPVRVLVFFTDAVDRNLEPLRTRLTSGYGPTVRRGADGNPVRGADGLPALTEGAALEGAVGNVVGIRFDRPADVEKFATEPGVLSVRLPQAAHETVMPLTPGAKPPTPAELAKVSGVGAMHDLGYTGAGVKVLLVVSDFAGADKLIGAGLPKNTRLLDLTTELNPDLVPAPADPNRAGNGMATARALAVAAPDAELVIVRIDPGALFQLVSAMRMARGEAAYTEAMRSRLGEINTKTTDLTRRKERALEEYRLAFADLADDEVSRAKRLKAKDTLDAVIASQTDLTKLINRFNGYQKDMTAALAGGRVIVNTLEWESGYPLDALSHLSRMLDQAAAPLPPRIVKNVVNPAAAPKPPMVWVQASSAAGASVWGGPFRDANRDSTMEYATPQQDLPPMNWSADMNFLGVRGIDGKTSPVLPAGAKLRVTMQWREPLDPNFPSVDRPAFPVVLRLFRQIDPAGEKLPSDEMAEDARSAGGPYPIDFTASYVVYEQILDFTVKEAGRYALVVTKGYEPSALLPALQRHVEVSPRVVVESLSGKRDEGSIVFRSYVTPDAGVGMPGDSAGVVTVGVPSPGELYGGGTGLTLRMKPDLFGPFAVDDAGALQGPGIATGFVGGMAVALVQTGAAGPNVFRSSMFDQGKPAIVPDAWLRYLRPARKPEK